MLQNYWLGFLLLLPGNTLTHWIFFNVYFRNVLIENFIPPEEKNKIMNRLYFDSEEDQWRLQSILPEMSVDHFHNSCYIKYDIIYINVDVNDRGE